MAYSEIKVIAGGLAHIPIIIGFFYFIQNKVFAKKTVSTNQVKIKAKSPTNFPNKDKANPNSTSSENLNESKETAVSNKNTTPKEIDPPSKDNSTSSNSSKNVDETKNAEISQESTTDNDKKPSDPIKKVESKADGSPSTNKFDQ